MSGYIFTELRLTVKAQADGLCKCCLIHQDNTFLDYQLKHIIGEKYGGPTTYNLNYACVFCNRYKGSCIGSFVRSKES